MSRFIALFSLTLGLAACGEATQTEPDIDSGRPGRDVGSDSDDSGSELDADDGSADAEADTVAPDAVEDGDTPGDDASADTGDDVSDAATDTATDAVDSGADAVDTDTSGCFVDCSAPGETACDDRGFIVTCADPDGDGCFALSDPRACIAGTECVAGACIDPDACSDECPASGASECVGTGSVRYCGNSDGDSCLEWSIATPCADSGVCSAGACPTPCTDECDARTSTVCVGSGFATCGNFDSDRCVEPGPVTACGAGLACAAGECVDRPSECLLFSEYVEGNGNTKAVEIQNCGTGTRDVENIGVCLRANSGTRCDQAEFIGGTLRAGEVLVVCNLLISGAVESQCDAWSGTMNFNGDDSLILFVDDNGDETFTEAGDTVVDVFGSLTVRPSGTPWAEVTYRRCSADAWLGRSAFDPLAFFTEHTADDSDDLGIPSPLSGCP